MTQKYGGGEANKEILMGYLSSNDICLSNVCLTDACGVILLITVIVKLTANCFILNCFYVLAVTHICMTKD